MGPRGRRDILDANISYDLQRLFDPYNFDHIPNEEDRLKLFKQRDLPHIKHYKAAVKIFGGPPCRTRVIVAPPMETPLKHRLGLYYNTTVPPKGPPLNGILNPLPQPTKELSAEDKALAEDNEKVMKYKAWFADRKKLRGDLDNLGLNENFLARKPNKTELEQRVQANFKAVRLWKPETPPPVEPTPPPSSPPVKPELKAPPPDGLQLLDKFLSLNRMRLMDLFLLADKDKSWSIDRQELLGAVSSAQIPLTEAEVNDIMNTLNLDLDDELKYKELNKGLTDWRKHQRELKKQMMESKAASETISIPTKGRQSKSIEERAESQEPSLLRGQSRDNASKPGTTQSKATMSQNKGTVSKDSLKENIPLYRDKTSSDIASTTKSRDDARTGTRGTTRSQTLKDGLTGDSDAALHSASKDIRTKTRDSSSQRLQSSSQTAIEHAASTSNMDTNQGSELPRGITSRNIATRDETLDSRQSKSLYEDILFASEDTARVKICAEDIGEKEEDLAEQGTLDLSPCSPGRKTLTTPPRPDSTKSASGRQSRQSRTSTPNSLEAPEPDLRPESMMIGSAEAMVDLRKHNKVVLSRNSMKNRLNKEQRIMFDEHPAVIKVGYKPIDDHCTESSLVGEPGTMVDQFRREKLKEYFMVKTMFEESDIPFTQKALDRVLLYPSDRPAHQIKKRIALPLGPLTDELSPFNQPAPKKRTKKKRRGPGRISRASILSGAAVSVGSEGGRAGGHSRGPNGGNGNGGESTGGAGTGGGKSVGFVDDDRSGSGSSKRSYINVEDIYPFAANVTPKVYKENLSSGRALITRKVDNWMTFEEYSKYTENLPRRFQHLGRQSNPDAAWPGSLLDKLRLYMDTDLCQVNAHGQPLTEQRNSCVYQGVGTGMYNGAGGALFRQTAQSKRAYPGYNNDLLTWPIGENGVRYGTIDEHRVLK